MDITGIGEIATAAKGIVDKFWPDKTEVEKAKLAIDMQDMMNQFNLVNGQLEINKIEAASTNWFVAGGRPFIMWICGFSLIYQFIFFPLFSKVLDIVPLDGSSLNSILLGILGLGSLRTFEKYNNVEGNR